MKRAPLIGITMDTQKPGNYSKYAWSALRDHYFDAVSDSGGIPVGIHYAAQDVTQLLSRLDGLLISGGDFDVPPAFYGQGVDHDRVDVRPKRSIFERDLSLMSFEKNIPSLGICGGMQIQNVALGGTLIQHIPDTPDVLVFHEQPNPRHEVGHSILIESETPLLDMNRGEKKAMVNSAHHQGVDKLGKDLAPMAWAEDGILEAFYHPQKHFYMGIQWHPEFSITSLDKAIFDTFIDAAASSSLTKARSSHEAL
ncbi:gamma-glutamyl-gamma-aminobutyrate hydrolase family protein [Alphaproteobacteria bacterium]|nr:gamma-glutamyl-gamma-aminobutyrate hydrolase family protein [Alphaproteobacteria bacterium]